MITPVVLFVRLFASARVEFFFLFFFFLLPLPLPFLSSFSLPPFSLSLFWLLLLLLLLTVVLLPGRVQEGHGVRPHAHRGHRPPVGAEPGPVHDRLPAVQRPQRLGQPAAERHHAEQLRLERVDDGDAVAGLRAGEDAIERGRGYGRVEGEGCLAVEPLGRSLLGGGGGREEG